MSDLLDMYDTLESHNESHGKSVEALKEAKKMERQLAGKLKYRKIMNGYVLTTRPENFEGYESK